MRARIRSIDLYSGHADGPELVEWIRDRLPLERGLFLVHGEPPAMAERLEGIVPDNRIHRPALDESFVLTDAGPRPLTAPTPARIPPEKVARLDWHNDLSDLFLDINDAVAQTADERARDVLIRRLRRALEGETEDDTRTHGKRG